MLGKVQGAVSLPPPPPSRARVKPKFDGMSAKERFKSFRMLFQTLHSYNNDQVRKEKLEDCSFLSKFSTFWKFRPLFDIEEIDHGPKILARKISNVALGTPQNSSRQQTLSNWLRVQAPSLPCHAALPTAGGYR